MRVGLASALLAAAVLVDPGTVRAFEPELARHADGGRTLIVVLDAVPYETVARLTREGLFPDFAPARPLISTFPSSTSAALPAIFGDHGLERSPGYEARFFDWTRERRRGGGPLSYFDITFPWREFFDWNRKGPARNALHAARPVRAGIREIGRALAAFEASALETFTIYVADTDTAAHLQGPDGPDGILRKLDAGLGGLRGRLGPGLRVVLLSDHGMAGGDRLRNVLPEVRRAVAAGGWRSRERLEGERDVILTPYGLVSSFEAYAAPSQVAALAASLAGVEGVDLCATRTAPGWRVDSAKYALTFERRPGAAGDEWRWQELGDADGGPAGDLRKAAAAGSWVGEAKILAATGFAEYPDPLYRLAAAFEVVANPASVICSTSDGFMYGSRATERTARWTKGALRWTHGSLRRDASLGFLMTSFPTTALAATGSPRDGAPAAVRFDAALDSISPPTALTTAH